MSPRGGAIGSFFFIYRFGALGPAGAKLLIGMRGRCCIDVALVLHRLRRWSVDAAWMLRRCNVDKLIKH